MLITATAMSVMNQYENLQIPKGESYHNDKLETKKPKEKSKEQIEKRKPAQGEKDDQTKVVVNGKGYGENFCKGIIDYTELVNLLVYDILSDILSHYIYVILTIVFINLPIIVILKAYQRH